ncbi:MAG: 2Fe-2S iron-sulfur cluster-binding protein [Bdellovibrionales bacterium]
MPTISFVKNKAPLTALAGENLMQFLLKHGVPVASSCKGEGICGNCRMRVDAAQLPEVSELENETLKRNSCPPDERLSCQIYIDQDLNVDTDYW